MRNYFFELSQKLFSELRGGEVLLCNYYGEDSDFARLNQCRVRQAGSVRQAELHLQLIEGSRHAGISMDLGGTMEDDLANARRLLHRTRERVTLLPQDPHLNYAREVRSTEQEAPHTAFDVEQCLHTIMQQGNDLDLVGIWASGAQSSGFANSLGQTNWHESASFNFDFSCYYAGDKAVKSGYAGFEWSEEIFGRKLADARAQLDVMRRAPRTLEPGSYRSYLAPAAVLELMGMLFWGGFGIKDQRTAQSPLLKLARDHKRFNRLFSLTEERSRGLAPGFTPQGFVCVDDVALVDGGRYANSLVDARGGREYELPVNSAEDYPIAPALEGGELGADEVLGELDTGLYINNLWYCNYSDRNDCRITGMTRFACFWVESGEIVAPVNVMRFDDSAYRMFGDGLIGLTSEPELLLDPGSYDRRSQESFRLPGMLIDGFRLTL